MKKYMYILLIMVFVINPKNVFAKSIDLKTDCKRNKENVECKILIDTNGKLVKGISYNYKNKDDGITFIANNTWSLNKSNSEGVLLVTKNNNVEKELVVGKITFQDKNKKSIVLKNLDIVYKCRETYCDYTNDKFTLKLAFNNDRQIFSIKNSIVLALVLILVLVIILIKKTKNKKTDIEII